MNKALKLIILGAFSLLAFMYSLKSGPIDIPLSEILKWLGGNEVSEQNFLVLESLRFPRTLAAFFIGAALGVCGLVLQTILRNPLAEPYTLGLSGGSCLGAIIALHLSLEPNAFWIPFLSTMGCLFAATLVLGLGYKKLTFESRSLILFGVMISLFFGAVVVSGLSILDPQKLQTALLWFLGEFGTSRDQWIKVIAPILIFGIVILYVKSHALDALSLGEARSLSLGYSPSKQRVILLLLCTIIIAVAVCVSGPVGFIGLVSPHLARNILKTSQHQFLLVSSAFIGATTLTVADSLGRTMAGSIEIPAGSVAALIGAPVLIYLLLRQKNAPIE